MLKNYFKIALRNIVNNKIYSSINIVGLAVGMAVGFIILLFVVNELSYDRYNKNLDDMFVVTTKFVDFDNTSAKTQYRIGQMLKGQFPEIKEYARWMGDRRTVIQSKDKVLDGKVVFADPTLFSVLTLPVARGNLKELSMIDNSAVISKSIAKKYFGNDNPLRKILNIRNEGGDYDVKICAVMDDIPKTSTFQADIIIPIQLAEASIKKYWKDVDKNPLESRMLDICYTYLLLKPGYNLADIEHKLKTFSKNYSDPKWNVQFDFFPLKSLYFFSDKFTNNNLPAGDVSNVYIYLAIGFLILLIACTNIVIINTGKASSRTKEIGLRKVVGASRWSLMKQILTESVLNVFFSLFIAVLLVELFLPSLSGLLGNELPSEYLFQWRFVLMFVLIAILVAFMSGSYIYFYLSKCRPIDILKNKMTVGKSKTRFRKTLVAFQMIIFIGLITTVIIIYLQMTYFHTKDFGFNKDNLLILYPGDENDLSTSFDAFKSELKTNPNISGVTGGNLIPASDGRAIFLVPNRLNSKKKIPVEALDVDKDFFEVMDMKLVLGKGFGELTPGELKNSCILNEAAVKEINIKNPIGDIFQHKTIVGVVKDFNMHSLREKIGSTVITVGIDYISEIVVKISSQNLPSTIKFVEKISKEFNNGKAMEYEFFGERIDNLYKKELKFFQTIGFFTGLAIFIACLGILGTSLFASQQRIKEIGIRKVVGASTENIFILLTKEFIFLTVFSTIIISPIAYYLMNKWLQDFAYRIEISWWMFVLSGGIALVIALATVSFQAIKAATANPVESLRYE